MSDAGRKDFSTKAQEKMTPDSQKGVTDKVKESVTDTTDKFARGAQTDDSKSSSQSAADKLGRGKDDAKGNDSILDKAKDAMGLK